jgi:hypothetical protein
MMFPNEIVNAEMERDCQLVRFEVFAVTQSFALGIASIPDERSKMPVQYGS